MRKTAHFLVALVAGVLIWHEARADEGPPSPRGRTPSPDGDACGAPYIPRCDGYETESCQDGHIKKSCCPQNAKCNYRFAPFVACGEGLCVNGKDPSLCVPRQPAVTEAKDEADCKAKYGDWEPACISGRVTPACIMGVPTNYMGPSRNPPFKTCNDTACTTSQFIEACYPERAEGVSCLFGWTKVCLQGRITERCIAPGAARSEASQGFVECGPGRCAIGKDANVCPAQP